MSRRSKVINPFMPQDVCVLKQSRYVVVPIPKQMAQHLGLVEGLSVLEALLEEGKIVYSLKEQSA